MEHRRLVDNVQVLTEKKTAERVNNIFSEYLEFLGILSSGLKNFELYVQIGASAHGDDFWEYLDIEKKSLVLKMIGAYSGMLEPQMRKTCTNFYVVVLKQVRCMELIYCQLDFSISQIDFVIKMILTGNYTAEDSLKKIGDLRKKLANNVKKVAEAKRLPEKILLGLA